MIKNKVMTILTSAVVISTIFTLCPVSASAEWKSDSVGWWYTEGNSCVTGWKYIDGNWYYFYSDGYMATNNKIGDYFVNSNGIWTNEITAEEAKQLVINEDHDYINDAVNNSCAFYNNYNEYNADNIPYTNSWAIPREPMYEFSLEQYSSDGSEILYDYCGYLVGKNSKNVYIIPNQGNMDIYQVHGNKVVKRIPWTGSGKSNKWRS